MGYLLRGNDFGNDFLLRLWWHKLRYDNGAFQPPRPHELVKLSLFAFIGQKLTVGRCAALNLDRLVGRSDVYPFAVLWFSHHETLNGSPVTGADVRR